MCGIVGIVDAGGVSIQLYYALYALQHRQRALALHPATQLFIREAQHHVVDHRQPRKQAALLEHIATLGIRSLDRLAGKA